MPKPVELRELALGATDDAAERAWLTYKRLAREVGGYQSPQFDDDVLADTILAVFGSWEHACWQDLTPEMWASKRKEFGRVYRACALGEAHGANTLPGFCDRENSLRGLVDQERLESGEEICVSLEKSSPSEGTNLGRPRIGWIVDTRFLAIGR